MEAAGAQAIVPENENREGEETSLRTAAAAADRHIVNVAIALVGMDSVEGVQKTRIARRMGHPMCINRKYLMIVAASYTDQATDNMRYLADE